MVSRLGRHMAIFFVLAKGDGFKVSMFETSLPKTELTPVSSAIGVVLACISHDLGLKNSDNDKICH